MVSTKFAATSAPLRAAFWMSCAAALFTGMVICVRLLSDTMSVFEINFFRAVIGLVAMLPLILQRGVGKMRTNKLPLYVLRTLLGYAGMLCFYSAIAHLDLVTATTLNISAPLFGVFFAWLILREKVRLQRWLLTVLGFVGAMVLIRPGFTEVNIWILIAFASAAMYALTTLSIKVLSNTEPVTRMVFYMNLLFVPASLPLALVYWVDPTWNDLPFIFGVGLTATTGHFCFAQACKQADASVVIPFDFLRLPFAAIAGFMLFASVPDIWTVVGGLIIFLSIVMLTRLETKRSGQAKLAATPDPVETSPVEDERIGRGKID
ncbi:MAG: DMT family transporter [Bauldia litoralis]